MNDRMRESLRAVRGMNDILPDEAERWEALESVLRDWLRSYGYRNIRTPLLEHTGLFKRAIGEATDIVEKEMYSFEDALNGEQLTLRPEATASTVRAALEHSLLYTGPQRLYYMGPMYRHERPQKGRYRQFHQVGAEALGFAGPDVDAEMQLMCARLWRTLGIEGVRLQLNSLGTAAERAAYRSTLVDYLASHEAQLDADSRRRMHSNPLRVLDSKNPDMQAVIEGAPRLLQTLGDASLAHFEAVQDTLRAAGMADTIAGREELAQCRRGTELVVELLETAIHGLSDKTGKPAKAAFVSVELVETDTFLQIRGDRHVHSPTTGGLGLLQCD